MSLPIFNCIVSNFNFTALYPLSVRNWVHIFEYIKNWSFNRIFKTCFLCQVDTQQFSFFRPRFILKISGINKLKCFKNTKLFDKYQYYNFKNFARKSDCIVSLSISKCVVISMQGLWDGLTIQLSSRSRLGDDLSKLSPPGCLRKAMSPLLSHWLPLFLSQRDQSIWKEAGIALTARLLSRIGMETRKHWPGNGQLWRDSGNGDSPAWERRYWLYERMQIHSRKQVT